MQDFDSIQSSQKGTSTSQETLGWRERIRVGSIAERVAHYANSSGRERSRNHLDNSLKYTAFADRLLTVLREHGIDNVDGDTKKGGFAWYCDIGEGQMLRISTASIKPRHCYKEPEILQPICSLLDEKDGLKIEVVPKVKTEGVMPEHIHSLVSSLAKKGLLFADCQAHNVGLMELGDEEIPVIIGEGSAVPMNEFCDNKELYESYYASDNNIGFFSHMASDFLKVINPEINSNLYQEAGRERAEREFLEKRQRSMLHKLVLIKNKTPFVCPTSEAVGVKLAQYFQNNTDYTHYRWVNEETGLWAQDEFVQQQGLAEAKETGKPKGIIQQHILAQLAERKDSLTPLAREIVELILEHSLREKDVKAVAVDAIHKRWAENFPDKKSLADYIEQHQKEKDVAVSI